MDFFKKTGAPKKKGRILGQTLSRCLKFNKMHTKPIVFMYSSYCMICKNKQKKREEPKA